MRAWSKESVASVGDLPSYGYRRVWGTMRNERVALGLVPFNAKRVCRIMRTHGLLMQRRPIPPRPQRRHDGKVAVARSNQRWCSDGFEFRCDNGEPLRVTFALDCCDREAMSWAATTAGHSGDIVRDVMLAAVEKRFGNELRTPSEIEWLSDNGSGYTAEDTRRFAVAIGLKPLTTPVCSPQSNGMAESFVKTMKRDYVAFMPKPDAATAARNPAISFEHYLCELLRFTRFAEMGQSGCQAQNKKVSRRLLPSRRGHVVVSATVGETGAKRADPGIKRAGWDGNGCAQAQCDKSRMLRSSVAAFA